MYKCVQAARKPKSTLSPIYLSAVEWHEPTVRWYLFHYGTAAGEPWSVALSLPHSHCVRFIRRRQMYFSSRRLKHTFHTPIMKFYANFIISWLLNLKSYSPILAVFLFFSLPFVLMPLLCPNSLLECWRIASNGAYHILCVKLIFTRKIDVWQHWHTNRWNALMWARNARAHTPAPIAHKII